MINKKIISIKKSVSAVVAILVAATLSFGLFNYGTKVINIRLSKDESNSLLKILDSCTCKDAEKRVSDTIKSQIKVQQ